ncbi:hypothetical protein [Brevundimonas guildfordensis]|uniref:Uncharacterized protein n=1 Tax=Brevundimonas guildfordensis TaxID=2762241 RepID=A0ABR8R342_9CAUL|nr:hypothetical protein [Brevundimonas guildfordensis]MBD7942206.1 hypothetical protein [Brevundimonas guildfordensis]
MVRALSLAPLPLIPLSLAAALALLPVSAAVAETQKTSAELRLESAAGVFEQKMEEFNARAERIQADESLSETQKGLRVAALWSEYQPHVADFTAEATRQAGLIAEAALAEVDVEAIVREATNGIAPLIEGLSSNGAWAQADPEHMVTYGLVAQYGVDQALDALDEVGAAALATPPAPPVPPIPSGA